MAGKKKSKLKQATKSRKPKPPYPKQHLKKPGIEALLKPRPAFEAPQYRPASKLEGKVALVTGGDSGIGRAVAVLFAREGAKVAFTYLPEEEQDAKETQRAIQEVSGEVLIIPGNITDKDFCLYVVEQTMDEFGQIDILVNNAAYQQHQENIEDLSVEQWKHTFDVNIRGYFCMVKAVLPHLKRGGVIINTGSVVGERGSGKLLDYSATKGAIHAFTKSLAQQLLDRGIRVNCVAPGPVWTPLNPADQPAEKVAHFGEKAPMGRPGQPEELAPTYVFLASNADSSYITGEIIMVTGGETVG